MDEPTDFELMLDRLGRHLLTFLDVIVAKPPLSWLDRLLRGPVTPKK